MKLTLDTETQVFFYEQDFYVLSNFSAFSIWWDGFLFATVEHAYHWEKFTGQPETQQRIMSALSAHEAFKMAKSKKDFVQSSWSQKRVNVMRALLRRKAETHEYVRRKLLATGERELIENSWRDSFWGWGENQDGQNQLGKLWMEIRAELRAAAQTLTAENAESAKVD